MLSFLHTHKIKEIQASDLLSLLVLKRLADLIKDGTVKQVDTARDQVGDKGLGLLDIVQNLVGVGLGDQASKVVGRVARHLGAQDGAQSTVSLVGLLHGVQGESAGHVGVEDKDLIRVAAQDLVTEMVHTSCSAQGLVLAQVAMDNMYKGGGVEMLSFLLISPTHGSIDSHSLVLSCRKTEEMKKVAVPTGCGGQGTRGQHPEGSSRRHCPRRNQ